MAYNRSYAIAALVIRTNK